MGLGLDESAGAAANALHKHFARYTRGIFAKLHPTAHQNQPAEAGVGSGRIQPKTNKPL